MPTYVYRRSREGPGGCPTCRDGFEAVQRMQDPPLPACPACAAPVERVLTPPGIVTQPSTRARLSDRNLKRHGFTKLINEGGGKFRKI